MHRNIFQEANQVLASYPDIILLLLTTCEKRGNEYVALNPTRHDRSLGSFSINFDKGIWADFATGAAKGDLLELYVYLNGRECSKRARFEAAKEILRRHSGCNSISIPSKVSKLSKVEDNKVPEIVLRIWSESIEAEATPVEAYLKSRGIYCSIPSALRYHHSLFHKQTNAAYPAMVAAVRKWPGTEVVAIHRTYLSKEGAGKANISPNKMMLGSVSGGAVMLTPPGKTLVIAEGIETALSVHCATNLATWAALSASNMCAVELPPISITQEVIIAADNDEAGIKAAYRLADLLVAKAYSAKVALPPESGTDFNDILRRGA